MSRQPESHEMVDGSQRWSCATLEAGVAQVAKQSQQDLDGHDEEAALLKELQDSFYLQYQD